MTEKHVYVEYFGKIMEMGDLASGKSGVLIEIRPEVLIEVSGFKQHDIMRMPIFLYKEVKLTIELIDV